MQRFEAERDLPFKHWFYLGAAVTMYVSWQIATWIGIWAGASIPDPAGWGLDFALPATFIAMLVPLMRSRGVIICVLVAGLSSLVLTNLPFQTGLIVAVVAGSLVGAAVDRNLHEGYVREMSISGRGDDGLD
jgi:predicted branched-subunit amino acid permease